MAESPTPSLYTDASTPTESPFPPSLYDTPLTSLRTPAYSSPRTFDFSDDFDHDRTSTTSKQLFAHPNTSSGSLSLSSKLENATLSLSHAQRVRNAERKVKRHSPKDEVGNLALYDREPCENCLKQGLPCTGDLPICITCLNDKVFCFRTLNRTRVEHLGKEQTVVKDRLKFAENETSAGMDQSRHFSGAFPTGATSSPRPEERKNIVHPLLGSPFEQPFETLHVPNIAPLPCTDAQDSIYAGSNLAIQSNSYYPQNDHRNLSLFSQLFPFDDVYVFKNTSGNLPAAEPPLRIYEAECSSMRYDKSFERTHELGPSNLHSSATPPSTRTPPDYSMDSIKNEELIVDEYLNPPAVSNEVEDNNKENPYARLWSPSQTSTLLSSHMEHSESNSSNMTSAPAIKVKGKPSKISPPFINCVVSKKKNVSYVQAFKAFSDKEAAFDIPLDIKELKRRYPYATFCNGRTPCDDAELKDCITCTLCEPLLDKNGLPTHRFPKYSSTKKDLTYVLPFDESEGRHYLLYRPELEDNDLLFTDTPTRPDYTFGVNVLRGGPSVTMELSALPFWGYMNFLEEMRITFPSEQELFQARLDSLIKFLDSPVPAEFYKALVDNQDLDQFDSMDVEPSSDQPEQPEDMIE